MKPKIALIVDTDNWAFYNRAVAISKRLNKYYDFKIIPATTALQENIMQVILLVQDCDLVHFFWRGLLFSLDNENIVFKRNEIDVNEFIKEKFSKIVKTTCIPDHSLLDSENIEKTKKALNLVDGYYTMSKRLFKIYEDLGCQKPQRTIIGGVEKAYFKPANLERFDMENIEERKIVTQIPVIAINFPCENIIASFKTVLISAIACSGIMLERNIKTGVIRDLLPIQPKTAVKKSMNGKIPITIINPISEAIP